MSKNGCSSKSHCKTIRCYCKKQGKFCEENCSRCKCNAKICSNKALSSSDDSDYENQRSKGAISRKTNSKTQKEALLKSELSSDSDKQNSSKDKNIQKVTFPLIRVF